MSEESHPPLTIDLMLKNTMIEERARIANWIQTLNICPGHKAYIIKQIRSGEYWNTKS